MFAETLKKVVDGVDGALAAVVMGLDGIPVETYVKAADRIDVNTVGMEFSFILTQVRKAGDSLQVGGLEELSVKAQRLTLVCRMISPHVESLQRKHPDIKFVKFDTTNEAGELDKLSAELSVKALPAFRFFLDGKEVLPEVTGYKKRPLEEAVSKLASLMD